VHDLGREQPTTIKELLDITTQHATSEEAVGDAFILDNVKVTATAMGARKGTKGGKTGLKWRPHRIALVASNDDSDEKAYDSSEECVALVEREFKHQMRRPKDHFEKLLEATCLHHSYPVKHKLKGPSPKVGSWGGGGGGLGEKSLAPIPRDVEVMALFDSPSLSPRAAT
jgi:hypothetical protein